MDKELTPREAYMRISGAIATDGQQVQCHPLLNWLKVALTTPGLVDPSAVLIQCPTAPLADMMLQKHRWSMVLEDLPTLMPLRSGQAMGKVARELGALVGIHREAEEECRERQHRKTRLN